MELTSLKLIARTNWSWLEAPTGYLPADGYTFKINFFKDATNKFTLTGVSEAGSWRMSITSANNTKANGYYQWQAIATKDSLDTVVASGTIVIYPNLASETDPRGPWTIIYQSLLTAYQSLVSKETSEVTLFDGTHVTYNEMDKLEARLERAKNKMDAENGSPKITRRYANFR